jgi:hypothetical protein
VISRPSWGSGRSTNPGQRSSLINFSCLERRWRDRLLAVHLVWAYQPIARAVCKGSKLPCQGSQPCSKTGLIAACVPWLTFVWTVVHLQPAPKALDLGEPLGTPVSQHPPLSKIYPSFPGRATLQPWIPAALLLVEVRSTAGNDLTDESGRGTIIQSIPRPRSAVYGAGKIRPQLEIHQRMYGKLRNTQYNGKPQ